MEYYAKVHTASPATGFITMGEILTAKQAEALGDEKIRELIDRGVLGEVDASPTLRAEEPVTEPVEKSPEITVEAEGAAEESEELPVLDAGEDIIGTADEAPEKPRRGRRKSK